MKPDRLGEFFDGKRAVRVDLSVTGGISLVRGLDQRGRGIKFRHDPVNARELHSALTSASGSSVRISKIEIIGRMRTNRNIAARNMPMVPMKVIQSQRVG